MKQLWIEDFLTLVEAGTFSRAAALRHVTQPAFSRRIQLLEAWLGVELVDRSIQPMRLTAVAERHVPHSAHYCAISASCAAACNPSITARHESYLPRSTP